MLKEKYKDVIKSFGLKMRILTLKSASYDERKKKFQWKHFSKQNTKYTRKIDFYNGIKIPKKFSFVSIHD
jgi:hypothetical protein